MQPGGKGWELIRAGPDVLGKSSADLHIAKDTSSGGHIEMKGVLTLPDAAPPPAPLPGFTLPGTTLTTPSLPLALPSACCAWPAAALSEVEQEGWWTEFLCTGKLWGLRCFIWK